MDLAQSSAWNHQLFTDAVVPSVNVRAPGLLQALPTPNRSASILVVDSTIKDYQQLIAGVKPGTEVHVLDPAQNAIDQITQLLLNRSGISSLHIVSHGAANVLQIGNTWIDRNKLDRYATEFKAWSTALTDNADILLYGCDVGKGDQSLIRSISNLTQADVAASTDFTGSARLGGNWTLEASTGPIESEIPFNSATIAAYNHVLPVDLISVAPPNLSSSAVGIDAIGKNAISGDGRFVVFTSSASTISSNDLNNASDVFLYDRQTNQVTLVSHNEKNTGTATGQSFNPIISYDGSSVAFISNANDLVNATANNQANVNNVFVWNRISGAITLVSQDANVKGGIGDSSAPSISDDGNFIAFQTLAPLLPTDVNRRPRADVYVWSREGGSLTHLSRDRIGVPSRAEGAFTPVISGDGNYVAFASVYDNLTGGDTSGYQDIFLWQRSSDTVINLTINGDGSSSDPTINRDGSRVAFVSESTQFGNDTNNAKDVFVWTRSNRDLSGSIELVSANQSNTDSGNALGDFSGVRGSQEPIISRDGKYVAFTSASSDLVNGDTNNSTDVFVRDVDNKQTKLISRNAAIGNGNSSTPDISADGKRIAFLSSATNLVADDTNNQPDIFVWDANTNALILMSRSPDNTISNNGVGNSGSIFASNPIPVISGDGSVAAFVSQSSNLVAKDRNGVADGFVIPVMSGNATLISTRNTDPNLASRTGSSDSITNRNTAISDDGRFVVFVSAAPELVGADGGSVNNVFLRDRQTGETILVSRALTGTANGESGNAMISADGRYVVFTSAASNLVSDDTNNATDVYLFDRFSNQLQLVSRSRNGSANGASINPTISSDGRYVVFMSTASDLVDNDTNSKQDVFLWDRTTGTITRVSDRSDGTSEQAIISRDGSTIAFVSDATNLVSDDTNGKKDVFVWTRSTNSIALVSRATGKNGAIGDDDAYQPSLSQDGRVIAFTSRSKNLIADLAQTSNENVFVRNLEAATTSLVSINRDNTYSAPTGFGTFGAFNPIVSANGKFVVFASSFSDLVTTDTNNAVDIFLRDLTNNKTQLVSVNSANTDSGNNASGSDGDSGQSTGAGSIDATISSTGRYVVFSSFSSDLVNNDTNNALDVFVRDVAAGTTTLVSQNAAETASGNGASFYPVLSSKGSYIAFTSAANNLTQRDLNSKFDVFGLNLAPTVSIAPIVSSTREASGAAATVRIRRNSTNGNLAVKLAIDASSTASESDYTIAAENGINVDRQGSDLTFTLPDGVGEAILTISAIDDTVTEVPETVVLKVVPTIDYDISDSSSTSIQIIDNDTTVTNTNDSGEGSLRQAILNANANAGKDTIDFQIPGAGTQTIALLSALPEITDAIVLSAANIVLDGVNAGAAANGVILATGSDTSEIQGIEIRGFAGTGLLINSSNNTIEKNKIVANGSGIEIDSTGLNNRISQNSIASNTGLGIDLNGDGITANDDGDLDTGANNLQNTVVITSAQPVSGDAIVKGIFKGAPNSKFQVELFRNDAAGNQGQFFLDTFGITTDANGQAAFSHQATGVAIGQFITATVTDADGNTSEFATAKEVSLPKVSISAVNPIQRENAGGSKTTYDFVINLDQPSDQPVSVRVNTTDGSATSGSDYEAIDQIITFDAGTTSKTVSVTVNDDLIQEPDETFTVSVTPTDSSVIAGTATSAIATIQDDDAKPTVSIVNTTALDVKEGNADKTAYTFEVRLSKQAASDVTVDYTTQNGTAISGEDYDAATGSITFKAGETIKTITVNGIGDTKFEQNETFSVNLTNVSSNAEFVAQSATATIVNDDTAPTIRINAEAAIDEGNPDAGSTQDYTFTVTLSEATSVPISVDYRTVDQDAIAGQDYIANIGTLTFAPNTTSQQIVVKVNRDRTVENDERFAVELVSSDLGLISSTEASAIGTIRNDDLLDISIKSTNASQTEGDSGTTPYEFEVSLSNPVDRPVTVTFDAIDGTAKSGEDYTLSTTSLTFAPGETTKTFTADIIGDRTPEDTESFSIKLKTATLGTIKNDTAIATINDNDSAPIVTVGNVSAIEGTNTDTVFNFDLTLSEASAQSITVDYSTVDGTATTIDQDYTSLSKSVTFNPGDIKKTVSVTVKGDAKRENDETFFLKLDSATNATIVPGRDRGVGTIQNDDIAPTLSISPTRIPEGGALAFTVTLDSASGETVSVDFETSDGSATLLDNDYTSATGKLLFAPGETSKTIVVQTIDDLKRESDETINVTLKNPSNATLATATAIGTIQNNDALPTISIQGGNAQRESGSTPIQFTVNLSSASGETVTVNYTTKNGTATDGDYTPATGTLTFLPGETRKTIDIQPIDDSRYELDQAFSVELSQPINASLATASAIGTVQDDDPKPRLTLVAPPAQNEGGNSALTPFVFQLNLDRASDLPVTVNYATANGSATTDNKDYLAAAATIEFKPGETQKTIAITVLGDVEPEPNETFQLNLSNPTNATLENQSVTATILNDDAAPPAPDPTNGRYDVLWRNARTGENMLWLTNSTVLESEFSIFQVPDSRWRVVATGDLDADGSTDIVWRNTRTGENAIWKMRNNQRVAGTFLRTIADTNWEIKGVGDFNGDRSLDLLWRNARTGENAIWFLKDMAFSASTLIQTVPDTSWNIEGIGDFDNDGISDIFWRNARTGQNAIWTINGSQATGRYLMTVGDLAWQPKAYGDFNRDNFLDILWSNTRTGENVIWLLNKGQNDREAWLPTVPAALWSIEKVADFNDDRNLDILWRNANTRDTVIWYMNREKVGYDAIVGKLPDNNWSIEGIGEFGGKGQPGILLRNYATGENRIWRTSEAFRSQVSIDSERDRASSIVATGDFDNDGKADIVWRNTRTGETTIWFTQNGGIREKIAVAPISMDSSWSIQGVGDFDRDGNLDLLWRSSTEGAVVVWRLNQGRFVGADTIAPKIGLDWKIEGIADFNGDRSLDIAWRNSVTGQVLVWFLNRTARFADPTIRTIGDLNWQIKGLADFNNDGNIDFLWQNVRTGESVIWMMNGTQIQREQWLLKVDPSWSIVGIADVNSDNQLDLLWRNMTSGINVVWYLNQGKLSYDSYVEPLPDLDWEIKGVNDF